MGVPTLSGSWPTAPTSNYSNAEIQAMKDKLLAQLLGATGGAEKVEPVPAPTPPPAPTPAPTKNAISVLYDDGTWEPV